MKKRRIGYFTIYIHEIGNSGPNFTTSGAPASLQDACIGVGAYVTSSMMKSQYGLSELVPDSQFTWSSRGPTEDGAFCPWISALGAAITSVPNYTLLKNQRFVLHIHFDIVMTRILHVE